MTSDSLRIAGAQMAPVWLNRAGTLAKVIALDPDRISIYNYAHLPDRFAPQRR